MSNEKAQGYNADNARVANQPDDLVSITVEEAKHLRPGDVLRVPSHQTSYGPARWRVNGKPKTWKTRPDEVSVPVKFGLRSYSALTEGIIHEFRVDAALLARIHDRMRVAAGLPKYKHDCDGCRYLGEVRQFNVVYDVYVCPSPIGRPVLVLRKSDAPEDYSAASVESARVFAESHYPPTHYRYSQALKLYDEQEGTGE